MARSTRKPICARSLTQLGVPFEPLDGVARAQCPLGDERLIEAAAQGMVPLVVADELCLAVAPRAGAARRIAAMINDNPAQARHFRFTTQERLNRFAMRCAGTTIAARASDGIEKAVAQSLGRPAALARQYRPGRAFGTGVACRRHAGDRRNDLRL